MSRAAHGGVAPPRLSINVSPWQLENPEFTKRVIAIIEATGVDPSSLNLEITESTFMRNVANASRKLNELNELGITFSIDDFGTGYSALAWLKRLAVHEIKIDRSFIHDLSAVRNDALVETILAIARHMGLNVVAEGVETEGQRGALELMGCRVFQGLLISPPLSESAFRDWIRDGGRASRLDGGDDAPNGILDRLDGVPGPASS